MSRRRALRSGVDEFMPSENVWEGTCVLDERISSRMRVLIVGAGPAGATAALELAEAGVSVVLAEKSAWPRAKTCGDGISPHAIEAGAEIGLTFEGRVHLERALITTPRGTAFEGNWPSTTPWGTTIERRTFDAGIVAAVISAGAQFFPATPVTGIVAKGREIRATLGTSAAERNVTADAVLIAEGATGSLAARLGFPPYRSRLVALRGYTDAPKPLQPRYGLFYDRLLTPGYGWIFPMDDRTANIGICVDERVLARRGGNARKLFSRWLRESSIAREMLGREPVVRGIVGGVIPTGRRVRAKKRVFLIGDAAGVADPFTAEGIFQAMQSGRFAARALLEERNVARAARRYERELRVFDRNERAARGLRATFGIAIGPYARRAARFPRFARELNTAVFLPKRSLLAFVIGLARVW